MNLFAIVRYTGFGIFAVCSLAALASWAVRTRQVPPFSRTARLLRGASDPLINPVERRLLTAGGNPVNAPWWLFGAGLAASIVLVSGFRWVAGVIARVSYAAGAGPAGLFWVGVHGAGQVVLLGLVAFDLAGAVVGVHGAGQLVLLALIVRVIGSWFGIGRYNRWMRPAYVLTDWIVEPLRKVIPPIGMLDITPLVAWFILGFLLNALPR